MTCMKPPDGWSCSREPGHDGPCAAVQTGRLDEENILKAVALVGALVFGSIGGLVVLVQVGFWSSILGAVFSAALGIIPGVLWGSHCIKRRKRALSQVRPPNASGVHPEVPVPSDGEAATRVAVQ